MTGSGGSGVDACKTDGGAVGYWPVLVDGGMTGNGASGADACSRDGGTLGYWPVVVNGGTTRNGGSGGTTVVDGGMEHI